MKNRILLLGFLVRVLTAIDKDFWLDEAISFAFAKQNIPNLLTATLADNHPPFYYLLLHFWLKFGQSPFFLRLPSIIFGTLSIYLVYLIGKNLFNEKVAVFSSALFAFSPLHVYFSAETRMYSLWIMLTLASFHYFLKIFKNPTNKFCLLFSAFCLLCLYSHYATLLFIFSLNVFFLLNLKKYRKQFPKLLWCQVLIGLVFLPWVLKFLTFPHPKPWSFSPFIGIPATFVSFIVGGLGQVTLKSYFFSTNIPIFLKIYFGVATFFLGFLFLKGLLSKIEAQKKLLLLIVLILPIIMVSLIHLIRPSYSPRLFISLSFPFYIFVGLGIESFKSKKVVISLKILTMLLLFSLTLCSTLFRPLNPEVFQQGAGIISENAGVNEAIAHTSIYSYYSFLYYLPNFKNQFLILPSDLTRQTTDIIGGTPKPISETKKGEEKIWLVVDNKEAKEENIKEIQKELSDYFPIFTAKINNLEILSYMRN